MSGSPVRHTALASAAMKIWGVPSSSCHESSASISWSVDAICTPRLIQPPPREDLALPYMTRKKGAQRGTGKVWRPYHRDLTSHHPGDHRLNVGRERVVLHLNHWHLRHPEIVDRHLWPHSFSEVPHVNERHMNTIVVLVHVH